ncbi:hypothetical protein JXB01_02520 [Candidatus Micrarchaeota archaeon]|nr:hypothetical protein [Candidatus Micrarchaeota archaeon]
MPKEEPIDLFSKTRFNFEYLSQIAKNEKIPLYVREEAGNKMVLGLSEKNNLPVLEKVSRDLCYPFSVMILAETILIQKYLDSNRLEELFFISQDENRSNKIRFVAGSKLIQVLSKNKSFPVLIYIAKTSVLNEIKENAGLSAVDVLFGMGYDELLGGMAQDKDLPSIVRRKAGKKMADLYARNKDISALNGVSSDDSLPMQVRNYARRKIQEILVQTPEPSVRSIMKNDFAKFRRRNPPPPKRRLRLVTP